MSLITKPFILSKYKSGKWVIEIDENHYIIPNNVKEFLAILKSENSFEGARNKFNLKFNKTLNEDDFKSFTQETLTKLDLVKSNKTTKKASFIKFEKIIINKKISGKIANYFLFLFNPIFFWISFTLLFLIACFALVKAPIYGETKIPILSTLLLYLPTILLHEIGHVAACKNFTGRSSEIGIGVYIVFPVFFSNISAIWHGNKEQRVIANLAGVYMQLWCMLFFIICYFLTDYSILLHLIFLTGVYNLFQLLPFIRSDGYWLLSDLTSTPNLLLKSKKIITKTILPPYKFKKKISTNNLFLFIYGCFNYIIIGNFIFFQLFYNWQELIQFPLIIWEIILNLVTFKFSEISFQYNYMTYLIFYILFFRILKSGVKRTY